MTLESHYILFDTGYSGNDSDTMMELTTLGFEVLMDMHDHRQLAGHFVVYSGTYKTRRKANRANWFVKFDHVADAVLYKLIYSTEKEKYA